MKHRSLIAAIAVLFLSNLTGCLELGYEITTAISSDGEIERDTRITSVDGGKDARGYIFPPGGSWSETAEKQVVSVSGQTIAESTIYLYRVHHRYETGASIPSDYIRKSKITARTSHNTIRPDVINLWFFKLIEYEETYQDVTDKETAIASGKKMYAMLVEYYAERLAGELEGQITKSEAIIAIKKVFDPRIVVLESIVRDEKFNRPSYINEENEQLKNIFDHELIEKELLTEVNRFIGGNDERLREVVQEIGDPFEESTVFSDLEENIMGFYGMTIFESYPFYVSLSLPGYILNHNGEMAEPGVLSWSFKGSDFTWEPYVIRASSLVYYPDRIAITVATGLVIVLIIIQVRKRSRLSKNVDKGI